MKQFAFFVFQLVACLSLTAQGFQDLNFGSDNTLEIVTWNIERFPKNGATTINYVTDIIESLDVDILAIQEVDDIDDFEQMVQSIPGYEGYLDSVRFGGLAYIYKTSTIEINFFFEIYTSSVFWNYFPRSPMVMDFNYLGERYIVINNHLKCCGDGFLDINDTSDEETRRFFANELLKDYVDTFYENDRVLIVGDLNDILIDPPQNNVFQMFFDDSENYLFSDFEIANGDSSNWSFPNWPSHLDHILITNEIFIEFDQSDSDIQTIKVDDYLPGGWPEYDSNVSDHRPVAIKLSNTSLGQADAKKIESYFSNYPNPLNSETIFAIHPRAEASAIEIFNLQGQKIFTETIQTNQTQLLFNADQLSNGIYIANLLSGTKVVESRKLVVIQ